MSPARSPTSSTAKATRGTSPVSDTRSTARQPPGRGPRPPRLAASASNGRASAASADRPPDPILFQQFFKSVGPRTYAAQVKTAGNGNPYLVLTEGKRDEATGEIRKTRLFVFSEDFDAFLSLLRDTARWIEAHPVPADIRDKRRKFWARRAAEASPPAPATPADAAASPRVAPRTASMASPRGPASQAQRVTPRRGAVTPPPHDSRSTGGRFAAAHPPLVSHPV